MPRIARQLGGCKGRHPRFLWTWFPPNIPPTEALVFWLLAYWSDKRHQAVVAPAADIATALRLSRATVASTLFNLQFRGALTPLARFRYQLDPTTLEAWQAPDIPKGRLPGHILQARLSTLTKAVLSLVLAREALVTTRAYLASALNTPPRTIKRIIQKLRSLDYIRQKKASRPPFRPIYFPGRFSLRPVTNGPPKLSPMGPSSVTNGPPLHNRTPEVNVSEVRKGTQTGYVPQDATPPQETRVSPKRRRIKPKKAGDILNDLNLDFLNPPP